MTESEWLSGTDPAVLLESLDDRMSHRKLRLFACACCRRLWPLLTDVRYRQAVEVAERFADQQATAKDLHRARRNAEVVRAAVTPGYVGTRMSRAYALGFAVVYAARKDGELRAAVRSLMGDAQVAAGGEEGPGAAGHEGAAQADLLRCVVGNPFRPGTADPEWLTATVLSLARQVYEGRAFDVLPILADAVQDAGCDNERVLNHCRAAGVHARGCWAVDLLLAKG